MWCPRTESNRGPIDYKSIALPAELQGLLFSCLIFIPKGQLNQSIINSVSISCLFSVYSIVVSCSQFVTDLSVSCRCLYPSSHGVSNSYFFESLVRMKILSVLLYQHLFIFLISVYCSTWFQS